MIRSRNRLWKKQEKYVQIKQNEEKQTSIRRKIQFISNNELAGVCPFHWMKWIDLRPSKCCSNQKEMD